MIDAEDDRLVRVVCWGGDKNPSRAGGEMSRGFILRRENPRAFHRYVDVQILVRQSRRISFRCDLEGLAAHLDHIPGDLHGHPETTVNAVILKEMNVRFDRSQIVDRDNFYIATVVLKD
jgi:hypothetical protein